MVFSVDIIEIDKSGIIVYNYTEAGGQLVLPAFSMKEAES